MAKRIDERIARAAKAETEAKQAYLTHRKEDSAKLLAILLTKSVDQRFAALTPGAQGSTTLVATDRLTLLEIISGPTRKARAVDFGFATRLEIFRSRLRYRTWPIIVSAMFLILGASYFVVAFRRTPIMLVDIAGSEPLQASVLHPDGSESSETFYPSRRKYQLMRIENDVAVLRSWFPGSGYEYFTLPTRSLERADLTVEYR